MDISATSQLTAQSQTATLLRIQNESPVPATMPADKAEAENTGPDGTRALSVFEADLQTRLKMKLRFNSKVFAQPNSSATDKALSAARQLVNEDPANARDTLIRFKSEVHSSAEFARQQVNDDMSSLNSEVANIENGLGALANENSRNQLSTTAVVDMETQVEQESKIRIRTAEGDIVRLSFKYHDHTSFESESRSDSSGSAATTEYEFGSQFAFKMKVDGDLNEAELASVLDIVGHAENISSSFYSGDMNGAIGNLGEISSSYDQIASFGMQFKLERQSEISYRETTSFKPADPAVVHEQPQSSAAAPVPDAPVAPATEPAVESTPAAVPTSSDTSPPIEAAEPAVQDQSEAISRFLRLVAEGFASPSDSSVTLHHSQSVKLKLLQAVVHASSRNDSPIQHQPFLERIGAIASADTSRPAIIAG